MFNKMFAAVAMMAAGMFASPNTFAISKGEHNPYLSLGCAGLFDYGCGINYPSIDRARRKLHRGKMHRRYGKSWKKRT
jgi:hypothetical protein